MNVGRSGRAVGGVVLSLLVGCGETGEKEPATAGAGGAASQAGTSPAGGNGTTAGGGGIPSVAGSNAAGSHQAGAGPLDCSGTFGTPEVALPRETGIVLGSPTLSPDGLELIYARKPQGQIEFRRSLRTSPQAAFPLGSPLPSLDAACQPEEDRSVDLSRDGLRAYVACYSATETPVGPATLHVAERASLAQDFTMRPGSSMIGPSAAISADELTLYSASNLDPGTYPSRQYTRRTPSDAFGDAADIPGLELVNITAPEPSPDGLSLYAGLRGELVVSTRPSLDQPFVAPTVLFSPAASVEQLGAPEVAHDCRSLYYLSQTSDVTTAMVSSVLMVVRR